MKNPFNYPKGCRKLPVQRSFLENVGGYFFYLGKTLNWEVLMVFHGDLDFFISMKYPSNYPIKCFARIKKITSCTFIIAGALIVILHWNFKYGF